MTISTQGIEMVKQAEGFRDRLYYDIAGIPTVGYGHQLTREERRRGDYQLITKRKAAELLAKDLRQAEIAIIDLVTVPLTQGQFDALVSFVYNVGRRSFAGSTLLKRLNDKDYSAVPSQLRRWNKTGTGVSDGLAARREREITRWLS